MKDLLMIYRNYLASLQYRKEYGDKYGDTEELIEMYEKRLEELRVDKGKVKKIGTMDKKSR